MFDLIDDLETEQEETAEALKTYSLTCRHILSAPPGRVLASIDYKNQELYFIAILSGDEIMRNAFILPGKLSRIDEEGKEVWYKNPYADLHTLSASSSCFPHIFKSKPEWEWDAIARDASIIKMLKSPRDYGKTLNFGIVYGQTALAMAELNFIPVETCQAWLDNHAQTFKTTHAWLRTQSKIAEARGWAKNAVGIQRWVREDNAKGIKGSAGRSGVNHAIQSLGSVLTKRALVKIEQAFRGTPAKLLAIIHDEILIEAPGRCTPNFKQDKKGVWQLHYDADEEAKGWTELARIKMEEAQTELFNQILLPEEQGKFLGIAEADIAPFWSH